MFLSCSKFDSHSCTCKNQLESVLLKLLRVSFTKVVTRMDTTKSGHHLLLKYFIQPGADPGFFFRRGCTRLLVYFNTNKPHSFVFLQNTSCIRKPQVISGAGGGCAPPAPSPLDPSMTTVIKVIKVF